MTSRTVSTHQPPAARHSPPYRYWWVVSAVAVTVAACGPGEGVRTDQPPPQTGGCLSIAGLPLSGCEVNYGYTGPLSPEERAMRDQARKFDHTVWQGVMLGALAGGAIGVLAGGDAKGAAEGVMIGAAVGAIAGAYVAGMQKRYANKEDQLNAMIADVQTANRESEALIADVRKVIEADRRRLAAVQARISRGEATKAELIQERGRAAGSRRVVEQALLGGRDRYRVFTSAEGRFRQQNPGVKTDSFVQALDAYQARLNTLDALAASMKQA